MDLQSLTKALVVLVPLGLGVLWMIGMMMLFGQKLNFFKIVVLPSGIGIGVDHGVHIYHRYLEKVATFLPHILRNTGAAITICPLAALMGYSGLIMARYPGLNLLRDLARPSIPN